MEPQIPSDVCVPSLFIGTAVTLTSSQQSQELVLSLLLSHVTAGFVAVPVQGTHARGRCWLSASSHLWKLLGIAHGARGWSSHFASQI